TISRWLVKPGDKVVEFEPMLEVDTDKVNAEVPAPVSGILREILAKEGETVQAGAEIAVVETGSVLPIHGEAAPKAPEGEVAPKPPEGLVAPPKEDTQAPNKTDTPPRGSTAYLPDKTQDEEPHR